MIESNSRETRGFYVDEVLMPRVESMFASFSRRAQKLGVEPPTYVVVGDHIEYEHVVRSMDGANQTWKRTKGHDATGIVRLVKHVMLETPTLKLAGWTLVATLDYSLGGEAIVHTHDSTGGLAPTEYRKQGAQCDHCKQDRRRSTTYVCRHDDGRHAQIGSSCLADFLGHDVTGLLGRLEMLSYAISTLEALQSGEEDLGSSCAPDKTYDLVEYLAWVVSTMRQRGWVSRAEARESGTVSTADVAMEALTDYAYER